MSLVIVDCEVVYVNDVRGGPGGKLVPLVYLIGNVAVEESVDYHDDADGHSCSACCTEGVYEKQYGHCHKYPADDAAEQPVVIVVGAAQSLDEPYDAHYHEHDAACDSDADAQQLWEEHHTNTCGDAEETA